MTFQSTVYRGYVVHARLRPKRHRLRYTVFSLLLDLDELPKLDRKLRFFAYNGSAPLSFHDADHGPANGNQLRPWIEEQLAEAGIVTNGGAIRLLCYPRIFGYVFNPLSVYFCYQQSGELAAILYEVCNTYRERHTYIIPVADEGRAIVRQSCSKALYVSPFIDMEAVYRFRIVPPAEKVSVTIRQEDAEGLLLAASFFGSREDLTQWSLMRCFLGLPLLSVKVILGIHWEALKMWLKGFPIYQHSPSPTSVSSSVGQPTP